MSRYRMFIDDTGEVDDAATNNPKRRYASITGVIFEWDYYYHTFEPGFLALRQRHFGLTKKGAPPQLRRHNLMNCEGPFECLQNPKQRTAFDVDIFGFYRVTDFTVITVAIDKIAFYHRFPNWQHDIYQFLVQTAIERYYFFLRSVDGTGDVMAEELNLKKDKALKKRFRLLMENGFQQYSAQQLAQRFTSMEIKIKPKSANVSGLQMADLMAAICFHHLHKKYGNGRGLRGFSQQVAEVIETDKFYRSAKGDPHGYGRIWRPQ